MIQYHSANLSWKHIYIKSVLFETHVLHSLSNLLAYKIIVNWNLGFVPMDLPWLKVSTLIFCCCHVANTYSIFLIFNIVAMVSLQLYFYNISNAFQSTVKPSAEQHHINLSPSIWIGIMHVNQNAKSTLHKQNNIVFNV